MLTLPTTTTTKTTNCTQQQQISSTQTSVADVLVCLYLWLISGLARLRPEPFEQCKASTMPFLQCMQQAEEAMTYSIMSTLCRRVDLAVPLSTLCSSYVKLIDNICTLQSVIIFKYTESGYPLVVYCRLDYFNLFCICAVLSVDLVVVVVACVRHLWSTCFDIYHVTFRITWTDSIQQQQQQQQLTQLLNQM